MPLQRCTSNGKNGWKWGSQGKCYTGADGKAKALAQGVAIGDIGKAVERLQKRVGLK